MRTDLHSTPLHGNPSVVPSLWLSVALAWGPAAWPTLAAVAALHAPNAAATERAQAPAKKAKPARNGATTYGHHAAAQTWGDALAQRQGLDPLAVRAALAQARKLPQVQQLILPPTQPTAKNWTAYRARFIEPVRIRAGLAFWDAHSHLLQRAEAETGVPARLVVGVLGVETLYGRHTGRWRVLDALATLAFDFPAQHPRAEARQRYFEGELGHFLTQTLRAGVDPTEPRGSYAGAMGLPQFMPGSVAQFAVDFDGDGRIDLTHSVADAIGSVAHYFKAFGWQPGLPTHHAVRLNPQHADLDTLLTPDILPTFSAQRLSELGATPEDVNHSGRLALIELHNGDPVRGAPGAQYVAGTDNFYAVTRYNWSSYYALAVIELGETIEHLRQGKAAPASLADSQKP